MIGCTRCCGVMWEEGMAKEHKCGELPGIFTAREGENKYLCARCGKMFYFAEEPEDMLPPPSKKARK